MIKILFVCHGNICRSPMGEYIFRDLAEKEGLSWFYEVDSAAVSREEIGNGVYPPARRILARYGVPCGDHRARQMTMGDYASSDLLIGMDWNNLSRMRRMTGGDPDKKCHLLLSFTEREEEIDDPWYTGDFESAYRDSRRGCLALLAATRPGSGEKR